MKELEKGDQAPQFSGVDQHGKTISLKDYKGKKVALYFYPKDDTPGCTKQACSLKDDYTDLQENGIVVLGVSPDDVASHEKFSEKYSLPFSLIADPDKKIIEKYGVWGEKNLYGKISMGLKRTTFLIDEEGKIGRIFKRPKTDVHGQEVLEAAKKI